MGRAAYLHDLLARLYNERDLRATRALYVANPSGVRYHLDVLHARGLIEAEWVRVVSRRPLRPADVVRRTEATLPLVPS